MNKKRAFLHRPPVLTDVGYRDYLTQMTIYPLREVIRKHQLPCQSLATKKSVIDAVASALETEKITLKDLWIIEDRYQN